MTAALNAALNWETLLNLSAVRESENCSIEAGERAYEG
jgi:hypothetical protein